MLRIAVVIPAYNEETAVQAVVEDVLQVAVHYKLELIPIVINDCSTDHTPEIIDQLQCIALHLPINLGIGGAVQTGFRYAYENGFDYAIQIDGDGQHPASAIPQLLDTARQTNADVVIGSRFLTGEGFQSSFIRRMGIRYFKRLNLLLTGKLIHDTTSGLRLLNRNAMSCINTYYPDEYPEPETIVLFARARLRIEEVPVMMKERQGGQSSINTFRSFYYVWKVTLSTLFTRIRKL